MSQGIAWNKEEVIRTLEPIFKLGCDLKKACAYAGIPYTTVHTWYSDDEELRIKINSWQNEPNLKARQNWVEAINKGVVLDPSQEWLFRKEKDEFSTRSELTGADGNALLPEKTDRDLATAALSKFKKHATGTTEKE